MENAEDEAIEHLLSFLDLELDHVTSESCIVIRDILRKYPERYEEILPGLHSCMRTIEEERGKCAVLWMIGEYGQTIRDAPHILEQNIEQFTDEESTPVRKELLTASLKLFFKRPPEMQAMLGRLLEEAINDTTRVDVRDLALLYYRLLRKDVNEANRIVASSTAIAQGSLQPQAALAEELFAEFNSLSIVFNKLAVKFIGASDDEEDDEESDEESDDEEEVAEGSGGFGGGFEVVVDSTPSQPVQQPAVDNSMDVFNIDFMGGGAPAQPTPVAPVGFQYAQGVNCDAKTFQDTWRATQPPPEGRFVLTLSSPQKVREVESTLKANNFVTMASGAAGPNHKFYFYCADLSENFYFVEILVQLSSGQMQITAKSRASADQIGLLIESFRGIMAPLL